MKKFVIAAAVLLAGAFLFAQESGGAYIRECTGTVEVKAPGASVWTAAQAGERISRDTIISTGFRSTALIVLGNSTLIVQPLTRLSLEEIQNIQGDESVGLYLQTGRVRANVNPPAGGRTDFTVRSPSVTASVRGTSFDFDGINLSVDEGRVHVTGGDSTAVYVGAGHEAAYDPETGKTAGAAEMVKAELTPTLPTAIESKSSIPEPAAIMPAAADTGFGFRWN